MRKEWFYTDERIERRYELRSWRISSSKPAVLTRRITKYASLRSSVFPRTALNCVTRGRMSSLNAFSLVEIILATSLFVLIATAMAGAFLYGQEAILLASHWARAVMVGEEMAEALRNIRDEAFSNLADGTHGLTISGGQWVFSGASDVVDIFTRSLAISAIDTRRKQINETVNWTQNPLRTGTITLESRLTDWRRDFSSWAIPSLQQSLDLPGGSDANEIAFYRLSGISYAVVVRNSSALAELYVIDISNPSSPQEMGSVELFATANDVAISGNFAVIASAGNPEFQVVDLSNPASPFLIPGGVYDLPGGADALSIAVTGDTIFLGRVASGQPEVYAISIAIPSSPLLLPSPIELGGGRDANKIVLAQNNQYLYVATPHDNEEFFVINVSNPSSMVVAGSLNLSGASDGTAVSAFSTYAALGRANGEIIIIDVSIPASPAPASSSLDIGSAINDLVMGVGDIYIFAATDTGGTPTRIIDVSNPSSTLLLGSVSMPDDTTGIVWDFDMNRAFVSGTDNSTEFAVIRPN